MTLFTVGECEELVVGAKGNSLTFDVYICVYLGQNFFTKLKLSKAALSFFFFFSKGVLCKKKAV